MTKIEKLHKAVLNTTIGVATGIISDLEADIEELRKKNIESWNAAQGAEKLSEVTNRLLKERLELSNEVFTLNRELSALRDKVATIPVINAEGAEQIAGHNDPGSVTAGHCKGCEPADPIVVAMATEEEIYRAHEAKKAK